MFCWLLLHNRELANGLVAISIPSLFALSVVLPLARRYASGPNVSAIRFLLNERDYYE